MKSLLKAVGVIAFSATAVSAAPMVYEPFDYADQAALVPGPGAHIGLTIPNQYTPHAPYDGTRTTANGVPTSDPQSNGAPNWIESPYTSDEVTNTLRVTANSLSRVGLPTSVGNKLQLNDVGVVAAKLPLPTDHTSGAIYYSMLVNVNNVADTGTGTASFFSGLNPSSSSGGSGTATSAAPISIHANGAGYSLGMSHRDTAALRTFDDSKVFAQDETVFVVVRYDLNAGQDNDVARMYLFGPNDLIPTSEPGTANIVSDSALDLTANNDVVNGLPLRSIMLRQNSLEPDAMQVDELRVGLTWDDAIGVPEPTGLALIGFAALGLVSRRHKA